MYYWPRLSVRLLTNSVSRGKCSLDTDARLNATVICCWFVLMLYGHPPADYPCQDHAIVTCFSGHLTYICMAVGPTPVAPGHLVMRGCSKSHELDVIGSASSLFYFPFCVVCANFRSYGFGDNNDHPIYVEIPRRSIRDNHYHKPIPIPVISRGLSTALEF